MNVMAPYLWMNVGVENNSGSKIITISGITSDFSPNENSIVTHVEIFGKKQGESKWKELAVLNNDEIVEPFVFGPYEWNVGKTGKYEVRVIAEDLAGNKKTAEKTIKLN